MKLKLIFCLILSAISIDCNVAARTSTKTVNYTVFKGQLVNLKADYVVDIQNNTHSLQKYTINYSLCAENKQCAQLSYDVNVASTDIYHNEFKLQLPVTYRTTGVFRITSNINIVGESSDVSHGYGSLTVYNN